MARRFGQQEVVYKCSWTVYITFINLAVAFDVGYNRYKPHACTKYWTKHLLQKSLDYWHWLLCMAIAKQ